MIEALIVLVIVGVILWFVTTYIPMAPPFKAGIMILGAIFCLIYVLQVLGITNFNFGRDRDGRVGQVELELEPGPRG